MLRKIEITGYNAREKLHCTIRNLFHVCYTPCIGCHKMDSIYLCNVAQNVQNTVVLCMRCLRGRTK